MASYSDIGVSQPAASTITMKVATIVQTRNSTVTHQEILTIGDAETTNGLARVLAVPPPSTEFGLAVRIVSGPSTATDLPVLALLSSTQADNKVTVYQSTAADLNVTVAGYSTIAAISSVAGRVGTMPFSTLWASSAGFHFDSSGALQIAGVTISASSVFINAPSTANAQNYLPVRLSDGSTYLVAGTDYTHGSTFTLSSVAGPTVLLCANTLPAAVSTGQFVAQWGTINGAAVNALVDSSGAFLTSTVAPSSGVAALNIRPVIDSLLTYAASTAAQSTATVMVSSAATTRPYVFAYSVTSTVAGGSVQWDIYDGANSGGTKKWSGVISSAGGGMNMAVSPPGYLFRGSTGSAMSFVTASSNGGLSVSLAYWLST